NALSFKCEEVFQGAPDIDVLVVLGLGAPHMLQVARRVSRTRETVFDACDSWSLQETARRTAGVSTISLKVGKWLARHPSKIAAYSYISNRDAQADAVDIPTITIPPIVDPALRGLAPVRAP